MIRRATLSSFVSLLLLVGCARSDESSIVAGSGVTFDTIAGVVTVSAGGPTAWSDSSGWRLVEDGALEGGVGTPGELVNPRDFAVDERGYVYVVDTKPEVIKVFDEKGRFVRSFGREGAGPGEFRVALHAVGAGRVIVHDPQTSRLSVFDTSGAYLRSWVGTCCYWTRPSIDTRGRIAVPTRPPDGAIRAFLRFDSLGTPLDTVVVAEPPSSPEWTFRQGKNMLMSTSVLFSPQGDAAFNAAGEIIHGWSGAYRLAVSDNGRDTTRVFRRAWTPEPLDGSRRDAAYDKRVADLAKGMEVEEAAVRLQFEKEKIPATLPAFAGISVDGLGNTWVHLDPDSARTRFDVFDAAGVYLGPVEVPLLVAKWSSAWGRGAMYVRKDAEDGSPRIARFRIERVVHEPVTKGAK
ncbi:MAG: 6-bladed beta-propeller [Gemmatimonadaceae bacterium]